MPMCEIHGGKRETRGWKTDGLLHLHAFQLRWEVEAGKARVGRKGGLWCPLPRQRFGAMLRLQLGLPRRSCPAAPLCPPCLSSPSVPEHNAPFTPRQTGGLDAFPAFCCRGHRLGSVPSSFFPRAGRGWLPARSAAPGHPPEGVTPNTPRLEIIVAAPRKKCASERQSGSPPLQFLPAQMLS